MTHGLIDNYRLVLGSCRCTWFILRNTNRVNTSSIQIGNEFYLVLISLKLIEKLSVTVGCCSSFDHY